MKIKNRLIRVLKISTAVMLIILSGAGYSQEEVQKIFLGIELNNVLCGYSEVFIRDAENESKHLMEIVQKNYISFKALGKDIEQQQLFTYRIDKRTGNFIYHDIYTKQGEHERAATMEVIGDSIYMKDRVVVSSFDFDIFVIVFFVSLIPCV